MCVTPLAEQEEEGEQSQGGGGGPLGCCPYLQLFKGAYASVRPFAGEGSFMRERPMKKKAAAAPPVSHHHHHHPTHAGGKLIFTAPCSRDGSLPLVPGAQPTNSTCVIFFSAPVTLLSPAHIHLRMANDVSPHFYARTHTRDTHTHVHYQ